MTTEQSALIRLTELESLDETRLAVKQNIEFYQARTAKAFDKMVRQRSFKKVDLVLAIRRPMRSTRNLQGKLKPKWEGPNIIDTIYSNGAYHLATAEGNRLDIPINGKFLKRYFQ